MLNLPDQRDFTDVPIVRRVAMAYAILAVFIIPAGFLIIALLLPVQLRSFKSATNPYEKTFWKLIVVGRVLMIVSAILFGLYFVSSSVRHANLILDGLTVLVLGFGAICAADYFGRVDEGHVWHKPNWLSLQIHV